MPDEYADSAVDSSARRLVSAALATSGNTGFAPIVQFARRP